MLVWLKKRPNAMQKTSMSPFKLTFTFRSLSNHPKFHTHEHATYGGSAESVAQLLTYATPLRATMPQPGRRLDGVAAAIDWLA
jgi:hypothetical protein